MVRHACTWLVSLSILLFVSGQNSINAPSGFIVVPAGQQTVTSVTGIPATIPPGNPISFTYWPGNYPPGVLEKSLVQLINVHRAGLGRKALVWHDGLARAAADHNIAMNGTLTFAAQYNAPLASPGTWDILGRLQRAQPQIKFTNLGIILSTQQNGVTPNATIFFDGGILPSGGARAIIERGAAQSIACNLNKTFNTWIVIVGQGVTLK